MLHCYLESVARCHWNLPQGSDKKYILQILVYRKTLEGGLEASLPALAQLQTNDFQLRIEQPQGHNGSDLQIFKVARDHMRMSASLSFFYQFGFLKSAFSLHICLHGSILFMFNHHLPPFATLDPSQHIESLGSRKSNT